MRDMDWKAIIAIHQHKNLTKAANSLFMSQPSLTKLLHKLEEELGVTLVERSNKGVTFTADGEYFVTQARKLLAIVDDTKRNFENSSDDIGGTLKIGTSSSFARIQLPKLLREYSEINNRVKFNVRVMPSAEVLESVRNDAINVGFVNGDRDHNENEVLCSSGSAYVISNKPIEKSDLIGMDMIIHSRDGYSIDLFESWWKNNFDEPMRIGYVVQDISTCLKWVGDGLGYGVVFSNYLTEDEQSTICKMPLLDHNGEPIKRNTWAICRRDYTNSPRIYSFIDFISSRGII